MKRYPDPIIYQRRMIERRAGFHAFDFSIGALLIWIALIVFLVVVGVL